jgi:hypothetical protein
MANKQPEWLDLPTAMEPYRNLLRQATEAVIDQEVSKYPILVAYQEPELAVIGLPVLQRSAEGSPWTVHISTLEELAARKVVSMNQVDHFREVYRRNAGQLCFLVWTDGEARFAFLPLAADESSD